MKHGKFTTGDILEAMQKSGLIGTVYDFRQFLAALPDQDDEWEECRFEDIRKGDTIKYETPDALIEAKPPVFRNFGDELALVGDMKVWNHPDAKWYRIPAPVQHPDPAEHPVILIREAVVKHDPPVVAIAMRERVCNELIYVFGEYGALPPTKITDWSPAKVVEDDR